MARKPSSTTSVCPVTFALDTFGDRWTLLVLRELVLRGQYRFSELLSCNSGLATNILSERLLRLQRRGLVEKLRDPADARRFLYKPTELGISLIPMLLEVMVWGVENGDQSEVTAEDRELIRRFKRNREALIKQLRREVRNKISEACLTPP